MLVVLHKDATLLPNLIPREVRKPGELRDELIKLPEQLVPVGLDPKIDLNVILSDGTAARLRINEKVKLTKSSCSS
jgi:hypothetical protein